MDPSACAELGVQQLAETVEVLTPFETRNRYAVPPPQGEPLLYAFEESGFLGRQFRGNHRPLTPHGVDPQRQRALTARRGFFWFSSHHVEDASGQPLGSLRRRFALLGRRFTLEDATTCR